MRFADSKIVPAAFWVGFLALGFATSLGGPNKHRPEHLAQPAKAAAAGEALVAQTARPAGPHTPAALAARD